MARNEGRNGLINARGKNVDKFAGGGGYVGWDECWGQEIIERAILPRTRQGDLVADLGCGYGRASMPFAMRGIKVIAIDLNLSCLEEGDNMRKKAGARKVRNVAVDIRAISKKELKGGVNIIIASDAINHLYKGEADCLLDELPNLLNSRQGGLVYIDAPSTESFIFREPEWHGARRADRRTLIVECDCSGELKEEPLPFYAPGELQARLARRGGVILATNDITRGQDSVLHEVVAMFKPKNS